MKPKILSWNVRGFNENDKRMRTKGLIKNWKADITCLKETKLKFVTREVVRSLWGCLHMDLSFLGSTVWRNFANVG
jgi:endonuclease/exonuclease/phosphatase family metal-dependent hydrolase